MTTSARKIAILNERIDVLERTVVALTGQPLDPIPSRAPDAASMAPNALAVAADLFGVSAVEITGEGRRIAVSRARWAVAWALRERFGFSAKSIGDALRLDHTTILYGCNRATELRASEGSYRRATDDLLERIANG